ncbi:nucleotidyltransferase domain-containing protein [Streptomyces sp. ME02-6979-3A]|uniref:Nucleotidyltransferase domain-containing protein n=1 Tax=Streptomyces silvae TaxID=2803812 RepID=A0ABU8AAH8_9ACTN|nr:MULTISPECIES: nucleotidyltransferase domain-containing protein [unclassified Streptomyces]MDX3325921.1 nucleotidyltransferase domain-containing protein [Streptomyces sp. ME02-6979-3A]MDX3427819.1 nucleotidyltransferase domain-containing protein [Streptomyces sp. ME01-18a]RPK46539.1 Nucleotidyltransferase domain protein [Streptomyces sp. ADI93-02]WSS79291.1 nucleotidyltransferase domain-containing protein [Streptomyces sp. NBC_01174]
MTPAHAPSPSVAAMASRLTRLPGIEAVALGGSRARGTHRPDSDWDLGVYYRGAPDLDALTALASDVQGAPAEVAGPGGWGPWVNGGAWLTVDGVAVDWILRDLDRVESVWSDCREGRYEVGIQPGHPLGFWSPCYVGEVALGRVLEDPRGDLASLQEAVRAYPEPLRRALTGAVWEADFSVASARKSAPSGDTLHVSLCLARAFGVLAQALHAHHRVWCLNEKGALASAAALPGTPADFAARVSEALRGLDAAAVETAAGVVRDVRAVLDRGAPADGQDGVHPDG